MQGACCLHACARERAPGARCRCCRAGGACHRCSGVRALRRPTPAPPPLPLGSSSPPPGVEPAAAVAQAAPGLGAALHVCCAARPRSHQRGEAAPVLHSAAPVMHSTVCVLHSLYRACAALCCACAALYRACAALHCACARLCLPPACTTPAPCPCCLPRARPSASVLTAWFVPNPACQARRRRRPPPAPSVDQIAWSADDQRWGGGQQ